MQASIQTQSFQILQNHIMNNDTGMTAMHIKFIGARIDDNHSTDVSIL